MFDNVDVGAPHLGRQDALLAKLECTGFFLGPSTHPRQEVAAVDQTFQ